MTYNTPSERLRNGVPIRMTKTDNRKLQDLDPQETREWVDALEDVIERDGPERAHFLIESIVDKARRSGAYLPYNVDPTQRGRRWR